MIDSNMKCPPPAKRFRRLLAAWLLACSATLVLVPNTATAQEEDIKNDARLEGYTSKVAIDSGDSTALTWLLLVFLAMLALGVMFKNAKRTHLD
jgi:4-hydroxybenzoate polyprenyltransferase